MRCSQCQGIEDLFDQQYVAKELAHYRQKGADKTTRMLVEALQELGVAGLTLLDIGGGVGAVQHALFSAGVQNSTSVDASGAYLNAAREEAGRRGYAERVTYQHGNFVDLAEEVTPADIVTLDRVICCYPDMEQLVGLSAAHSRKLYGLVFPRDDWWVKIVLALQNFYFGLKRSPFRTFSHSTQAVEDLLSRAGLRRRAFRRTLAWQVVVYVRQ